MKSSITDKIKSVLVDLPFQTEQDKAFAKNILRSSSDFIGWKEGRREEGTEDRKVWSEEGRKEDKKEARRFLTD